MTAGQPAVLKGGGSEADFVDLPDGGLVAVVRNEAGDGGAWGSKVCKASAGAPGRWSCQDDKRKFDSPLLFRRGGDVFLVARRHLSGSGDYDLGLRWLPPSVQTAAYQLDYWRYPKRCALWRVDPATLRGRWQVDLPSRGDTCFPAVPGRSGVRPPAARRPSPSTTTPRRWTAPTSPGWPASWGAPGSTAASSAWARRCRSPSCSPAPASPALLPPGGRLDQARPAACGGSGRDRCRPTSTARRRSRPPPRDRPAPGCGTPGAASPRGSAGGTARTRSAARTCPRRRACSARLGPRSGHHSSQVSAAFATPRGR